jgi:hypothetical protein
MRENKFGTKWQGTKRKGRNVWDKMNSGRNECGTKWMGRNVAGRNDKVPINLLRWFKGLSISIRIWLIKNEEKNQKRAIAY